MALTVKVHLWDKRPTDKYVAAGYVVVNDAIQINITLWGDDSRGYFISYPGYKKQDGKWQETAGPVNKEIREAILDAVQRAKTQTGKAESKPAPKKTEDVTESINIEPAVQPAVGKAPW